MRYEGRSLIEAHSNGLLESLVRLDLPVAALDRGSRILWVSDGWKALDGQFLPKSRADKDYLARCRAASAGRLAASVQGVLKGKHRAAEEDYRFPTTLGRERFWRARITRGTGDVAAIVSHHEVTQEEMAHRRVEEASASLEQLLAVGTLDAVTFWDRNGVCVWASPSVQAVFGHPPAALLNKKADWLVARRFLPSLAKLAKLPAGSPMVFVAPVSGKPRTVEVTVHRAASGPLRYVAVARSIDERLDCERRLQWKRLALEGAEELAQLGIWLWRPNSPWEWSPSLFVLHALRRTRPPSPAAYLKSVHPEDRGPLERLFNGRSLEEVTFRYRRADGVVRTLRLRCRTGPEEERVGVVRDVTEELALQRSIVRLFSERAELLREHFNARDRERLMLAQELHDQLGASLTALLLTAKRLSRKDAPRQAVSRLAHQARELLDTVRSVTRRLHVSHLEVLPFKEALGRLVDGYRDATCARLSIEFSGALPTHAPAGLLRIVQECLTNAVRHARASRVHVSCLAKAKAILLTIEDDGAGLQASGGQGMGLSGIVHRAEAMGGSAHIRSRRGQGTRIEVRVPSLFRGWSSP